MQLNILFFIPRMITTPWFRFRLSLFTKSNFKLFNWTRSPLFQGLADIHMRYSYWFFITSNKYLFVKRISLTYWCKVIFNYFKTLLDPQYSFNDLISLFHTVISLRHYSFQYLSYFDLNNLPVNLAMTVIVQSRHPAEFMNQGCTGFLYRFIFSLHFRRLFSKLCQ
mgnify:CR=1 FL=1